VGGGWALQIVHALFGSDVLIPRLSHSSNEMKAWEVYVGSICMHNEFVCWANTSKNGLSLYCMSGGLGTVAVTGLYSEGVVNSWFEKYAVIPVLFQRVQFLGFHSAMWASKYHVFNSGY